MEAEQDAQDGVPVLHASLMPSVKRDRIPEPLSRIPNIEQAHLAARCRGVRGSSIDHAMPWRTSGCHAAP